MKIVQMYVPLDYSCPNEAEFAVQCPKHKNWIWFTVSYKDFMDLRDGGVNIEAEAALYKCPDCVAEITAKSIRTMWPEGAEL